MKKQTIIQENAVEVFVEKCSNQWWYWLALQFKNNELNCFVRYIKQVESILSINLMTFIKFIFRV